MNYKISAIAIMTIACLAGTTGAWAESIERSSDERINTVKPRGIQVFTGTKPTGINEIPARQTINSVGGRTINIAQPTAPGGAQPAQAQQQVQQPATRPGPRQLQAAQPALKPVKRKKRTSSRKRRKKKSRVSEAKWWRDSGNPKVFAFRDCISAYARSRAQKIPKLNLRSVVARSIKRECDKSFSSMSKVLASRFGTRKSRKIAKELTGSTFVPAVRKAVLKVREEQKLAAAAATPAVPAVAPATQAAEPTTASLVPSVQAQPDPISVEAELELAKEEMFSCYRDAADRTAPQSNQPVDAVVDNVLLECSGNTRAFFKRLFAVYPHSPSAQAERMRAAISDNYRPAIEKRVTAIRATGVSVIKQKVTSTAQ
ncbi:hypothetical protein [Anderseniella sp. Alg231-50]|uniref:hypothetical protein n=1 Tax=Anderseniella sp. Alg231-50 TaxID=1922226 RepID=UPI000D54C47F